MIGSIDMPRRLPKYCCEDTDRHDKVRVYLRRPGLPKVRLRGKPWSKEFMAAYAQAMEERQEGEQRDVIEEATWGWLCRRYFASGQFASLGERTQIIRRRILEKTFREPREPGSKDLFQHMPLEAVGPAAIRVLRDRLAKTPEASNERLKAIRQAFVVGIENEHWDRNPARDVPYIRNPTDGFYPWTETDIGQYCETYPPGSKQRRALVLLLVLGPRRQDAVTLGRQNMKNGRIKYKPLKTRKKANVEVDVEISPELQAELDLAPAGDMLFIQTEHGKAYTVGGFYNWFKRQCVLAGLPRCSPHGLRKAGAQQRADNGATDYGLMALYGWLSPKTSQIYTRGANRKKLAAGVIGLLTVPLENSVGLKAAK